MENTCNKCEHLSFLIGLCMWTGEKLELVFSQDLLGFTVMEYTRCKGCAHNKTNGV